VRGGISTTIFMSKTSPRKGSKNSQKSSGEWCSLTPGGEGGGKKIDSQIKLEREEKDSAVE